METFLSIVLLLCGQLVNLSSVRAASNSRTSERLKHSYLGFPRLHFTGYFHSDPMTANNRLINHNMTRNRGPRIQADSEGFNSVGTGNFMFYNAYVSGVCYMDGTCTSQDDEILGQSVEDWFDRAPAKLVDISPTCDTLSNIHGMKLQVGQIIRAALTPTPVQQMWPRCIETPNLSTFSAGAQFKSVLTNVTWLDGDPDFESQFVEELKESDPQALAVKFNLDQYDSRVVSDKFRLGRLVGTIGPHHPDDSIPFMRFTRQLQAGDSECTGPFCHAPFSIDHAMNLLTIDVGNSFRSSFNGSFNTQTLGRLYVGFRPALGENSEVDCNSQVVYAGEINYTTEYWYERTAGVVTLNLTETLSGKAIKEQLHISPLVIFKYKKENGTLVCQKPVLVERHHGLTVGAMVTNTYRKEPGEAWTFHLFASKFGVPQPGVELSLNFGGEHCPMQICGPCTTGFSTPQSALSFPPFVVTDKGGFANIPLMAYDPMEGAPYPHVVELQGSQLYLLFINMSYGGISDAALFHLGARVFQIYHVPDTPTWYDHVLPTLESYHHLFPVMRSFVYLSDYYSVIENKDKMKAVLSLPIDDPHHMPTTRDLSKSKRKMLLGWLENPILGQPAPSIENLRSLLQQALELELSTIPPYLTALMSIKEGFNVAIGRRIKSVVVQEMLHMALVGNLLNAVGGSPSIASTLNAPLYPSKLPGGVRPDLVVSLQKLSREYIETIFMEIEKPSQLLCSECKLDVSGDGFFQQTCSASTGTRCGHLCSYRDTRGAISTFYNRIKELLITLNETQGASIFTGNVSTQIKATFWYGRDASLFPFAIVDLHSALKAIDIITEQGEGSDVCTPVYHPHDLSHYFKFAEIVYGREVRISRGSCLDEDRACTKKCYSSDTCAKHSLLIPRRPGVVENNQKRFKRKGKCSPIEENVYTPETETPVKCDTVYSYSGSRIAFSSEGIWPMVPNPTVGKFKNNSMAVMMADVFTRMYSGLLYCLQKCFNGFPTGLRNCIGLMHALYVQGQRLVQTPLIHGGNPDIGPNAGPTFRFIGFEPGNDD